MLDANTKRALAEQNLLWNCLWTGSSCIGACGYMGLLWLHGVVMVLQSQIQWVHTGITSVFEWLRIQHPRKYRAECLTYQVELTGLTVQPMHVLLKAMNRLHNLTQHLMLKQDKENSICMLVVLDRFHCELRQWSILSSAWIREQTLCSCIDMRSSLVHLLCHPR